MSTLERFTISIDRKLLKNFDRRNNRMSYANRSEAIRDLIRSCLVDEEIQKVKGKIAATVTIVYNHHQRELSEQLTRLQHHHNNIVVATSHIHLDNDNCLEVAILRGPNTAVHSLAEALVAQKGVKHGKAIFTTEGKDIW